MIFLFWDFLILTMLAGQIILLVKTIRRNFWPKYPFRRALIGVLFFFGTIIVFYGSFIEPWLIRIRRQSIDLTLAQAQTPKKIKIALTSDFHLGPYKGRRFMDRVIRQIQNENPDITLMAGDFIYTSTRQARHLERLKNLKGVKLAVLGNHDYNLKGDFRNNDLKVNHKRAKVVAQALEKGGVTVLKNQAVIYQDNLSVIGLDEYWTGQMDISAALPDVPVEKPRIVFVHNPDAMAAFAGEKIDLVLAGHTHAGQIRLPFIGAVGPIPTALGQRIDHGFFDISGYKTYITGGLGESGPRARLFNPPEIVILEISI